MFVLSRAAAASADVPRVSARGRSRTTGCRPSRGCRSNPRQDLQRSARDARTALLDGYGWVDKNAGVVRIPIDEAMKLTLSSAGCRRDRRPQDERVRQPNMKDRGFGVVCVRW